MTNQQIVQIAMTQSAIELNCQPEDFLLAENKIVPPFFHQDSRKYLTEPFVCQMVSYGNNIVASVREDLQETVRNYLGKYQMVHCFETPNMHVLNLSIFPENFNGKRFYGAVSAAVEQCTV